VDGREPPAADRPPGLPDWFQTLGRGAWLLVRIAVLLAITFFLLGLISDLLIPLIFAAILAAIFVPLVDRLERWHLPRWLGAPLVVVLAIGVVALITWSVVAGLHGRDREILARVTAGLDEGGSLAGVTAPDTEEALKFLGALVKTLLGGLLSGLSSVTVLIVGIVTGLFILLFLMKDWRLMTDAGADRIDAVLGLPAGVGRQIVSDTVKSFRSYALGVTIIGLMNGVVIGLGAALAMLAITLLTNNTLQNLLEPLVFGKTLRLHPLVVMLVTTAGTLLFGLLGAALAAPVTAVTLRTIALLRGTGPFRAVDQGVTAR
jgi:predicted PurR-regulated permease PerM